MSSLRGVNCLGLTPLFVIFSTISGCGSTAITTVNGDANQVAPAVLDGEDSPRTTNESPVPGRTNLTPSPKTGSDPPVTATKSAIVEVPAVSTYLVDKTFDDIKFDIEPDAPFERSLLTPEIEALAGQRIRIRGYILPTAQKRGIKQFVLVRDNQECCFGPGAALYDCILIKMQPGKTAEFSIRPVAVAGKFEIQEFKGPDGRHLAIFQMHGEEVE
jgi:hypothetical protein